MSIVFFIESLPLFFNYSITGEWMNMYNVAFVDLIVIISVTPYMYAAFTFEEWRQCYIRCCPCIPDWNTLIAKRKKTMKNDLEVIVTPPSPQEDQPIPS